MKWLITISTNDAETAHNAMRLAHVALKKAQEVSVYMMGKAVEWQEFSTQEFNVASLTDDFMEAGGDFFVGGVCLKIRGQTGSASCPLAWMDDLYELMAEADKVITF